MKKDIEQLINCIKSSPCYTLGELGIHVPSGEKKLRHIEIGWQSFANKLMATDTGLTVGNIFRIRECEDIFPNTILLGIVGSPTTGNLILHIDRVRLRLEKQCVVHQPRKSVESISVATHPYPKTNCAIVKVFRQYTDVVKQIQQHSQVAELEDTLLSHLFEYVLHGGTLRTAIPTFIA